MVPQSRGLAGMAPAQSTISPGQIAEALALRDKYRLKGQDGYLRIPMKLLAVHRENRSGLCPSPARVIGLLCSILLSGFNTKEANHEGVVVQELPPEQHEAFRQKWGICYKTFREYNIAKVGSVSALRPAFTETITCQFGTLSHSTLVVGLLCLWNGAVWDLFEEHKGKGWKQCKLVRLARGTWRL